MKATTPYYAYMLPEFLEMLVLSNAVIVLTKDVFMGASFEAKVFKSFNSLLINLQRFLGGFMAIVKCDCILLICSNKLKVSSHDNRDKAALKFL